MAASKLRFSLVAFTMGIFGIAASDPVQAACQKEERPFARAADRAIKSWQIEHGYRLTPSARQGVVETFCSSAARLVAEEEIGRGAVAQAAREPLWDYLDQMLVPGAQATPLSDLLFSLFVLRSFPALPEPRRMGVIHISYQRSVDTLIVAGKRMEPAPTLLAETGDLSVNGFTRGRRVCGGVVKVRAHIAATFRC